MESVSRTFEIEFHRDRDTVVDVGLAVITVHPICTERSDAGWNGSLWTYICEAKNFRAQSWFVHWLVTYRDVTTGRTPSDETTTEEKKQNPTPPTGRKEYIIREHELTGYGTYEGESTSRTMMSLKAVIMFDVTNIVLRNATGKIIRGANGKILRLA